MDLQNVEIITEQTQLYQNIAIVLLVVAILLFITSVVLFIVLKIPHSFRVLTGMGINKELSKESAGRDKKKAILTWGASGTLTKKIENDATTLLDDDATTLLGDTDATTVLGGGDETTLLSGSDETTLLLGNDETTLLSPSDETTLLTPSDETTLLSDVSDIFQMEDDIKITGSNQQI